MTNKTITINEKAADSNASIMEFSTSCSLVSNRNCILLPVLKVYTVQDASFDELCLIHGMINR